MIIKPNFIIICREAFLEAGTNNLNLIRIFSQVHADVLPFQLPPFALVVNFDIDEAGQHVLRTDVFGPDHKQIAHTELPVTTNVGNWQIIANFERLTAPVAGTYTFQLMLDDTPLGSRALEVKSTTPPKRSKSPAIA
jgi:hypothetical protein